MITKPNLDPEDVMKRVVDIYGLDYLETDIPTYYRIEQAKREQELADLTKE